MTDVSASPAYPARWSRHPPLCSGGAEGGVSVVPALLGRAAPDGGGVRCVTTGPPAARRLPALWRPRADGFGASVQVLPWAVSALPSAAGLPVGGKASVGGRALCRRWASVGGLGASVGGAAAGCGVSRRRGRLALLPRRRRMWSAGRWPAGRRAGVSLSRSLPSFRRAGRGGAVFLYTRRLDMAFGCHSKEEKITAEPYKWRFALPMEANLVMTAFLSAEQEHHQVNETSQR